MKSETLLGLLSGLAIAGLCYFAFLSVSHWKQLDAATREIRKYADCPLEIEMVLAKGAIKGKQLERDDTGPWLKVFSRALSECRLSGSADNALLRNLVSVAKSSSLEDRTEAIIQLKHPSVQVVKALVLAPCDVECTAGELMRKLALQSHRLTESHRHALAISAPQGTADTYNFLIRDANERLERIKFARSPSQFENAAVESVALLESTELATRLLITFFNVENPAKLMILASEIETLRKQAVAFQQNTGWSTFREVQSYSIIATGPDFGGSTDSGYLFGAYMFRNQGDPRVVLRASNAGYFRLGDNRQVWLKKSGIEIMVFPNGGRTVIDRFDVVPEGLVIRTAFAFETVWKTAQNILARDLLEIQDERR